MPFLILFSCALLATEPALARLRRRPRGPVAAHGMQFLTAVYGGYFGAGLGIILLAVLGLTIDDDLQRLNALKGLLSLVIGASAAGCFGLFGPVASAPPTPPAGR